MKPSMITARTLSVLPDLVVAECGHKRLAHVCQQAGLPASLPQAAHREFFIPQMSLLRFVDAAGRELGVSSLGLMAAHMVSVRDYGVWGDYLLSAPTLRDSLRRALPIMHLHSTGDTLTIVNSPGGVDIRYRTAVAGARYFENISYIGLGVIESVVKHFAGQSWRPDEVSLDFVIEHRGIFRVEEALGSRVRFGGQHVSLFVPDHILDLPNPAPASDREITLADVTRVRRGRSPITSAERIKAIARLQLLEGQPDLDKAAEMLMIGQRTLQRRLSAEGTSFRAIVNETVIERASELLCEPDISITQTAAQLGYSSSSHFARAFRHAKGLSPTAFRNALSR